jgi:hypothetical protein
MMCSGHSHCASAVEVPTRTPSWHSQRRERGENTSCGGAPGGGPAPKAARMLARAAAGCRRACAALGAADRPVGAEDQWARGRENTRVGRPRACRPCLCRGEVRTSRRPAFSWRLGTPLWCPTRLCPRDEAHATARRAGEPDEVDRDACRRRWAREKRADGCADACLTMRGMDRGRGGPVGSSRAGTCREVQTWSLCERPRERASSVSHHSCNLVNLRAAGPRQQHPRAELLPSCPARTAGPAAREARAFGG